MTGGRFGGALEYLIVGLVIFTLGILPSVVEWICR